jgi:hypothetical protein
MTSPASGFENLCAEGTLECGGLTPPWNYRGRKSYTTHQWCPLKLFSQETRSAPCKGGVEPPHSKALRAFSWFLGVRRLTNTSDCFENRGAGVPPAVARASGPRAGAGRSRDRGRDARATSVHCRPIFTVSGWPSADEHERLLWNRRSHPSTSTPKRSAERN